MTLEQIKAAVAAGTPVYWGSRAYEVIHGAAGWFIRCWPGSYTPLEVNGQLQGDESEFFTI